jgi:hypothetical protein
MKLEAVLINDSIKCDNNYDTCCVSSNYLKRSGNW